MLAPPPSVGIERPDGLPSQTLIAETDQFPQDSPWQRDNLPD